MVPFWVLEQTPAPAQILLEADQLIFENKPGFLRRNPHFFRKTKIL